MSNSSMSANAGWNGDGSGINIPVLLERCMDDAALASMLLVKFDEQAASSMTDLASSVARADLPEAARRAHAMKGTAGAVAADALMNAASKLEEAAIRSALGEAEVCVAEVRGEMDRCRAHLPEVRRALSMQRGQ